MLYLVAWAAAARVEGGGGALIEVEGAAPHLKVADVERERGVVMVLTAMERACRALHIGVGAVRVAAP